MTDKVKKTKKTPNHNTPASEPTTKLTNKDGQLGYCIRTREMSWYPLSHIQRVADRALEFSADPDPRKLTLTQFLQQENLSRRVYHDWCEKYPWFKENHAVFMERLGNKREIGMIMKEYDAKPIMHMQHRYDNAWAEADAYHASLRNKQDEKSSQPQIIVIPAVPNSNLVPEKSNKKDTDEKEKE